LGSDRVQPEKKMEDKYSQRPSMDNVGWLYELIEDNGKPSEESLSLIRADIALGAWSEMVSEITCKIDKSREVFLGLPLIVIRSLSRDM